MRLVSYTDSAGDDDGDGSDDDGDGDGDGDDFIIISYTIALVDHPTLTFHPI